MIRNTFAGLLVFMLLITGQAHAGLTFIVDVTATNNELGYVSGQDYQFTFTYDPSVTNPDVIYEPVSPGDSGDVFNNFEYKNRDGGDSFWLSVEGEGITGTYNRDFMGLNRPFTSINTRGRPNVIRLTAGATFQNADTGLDTGGQDIETIQFDGSFEGLSLDVFSPTVDPYPVTYFADYYGTYNPVGTSVGFIQPLSGSNATFQINTLTIVPEPNSLVLGLIGIAGLLIRRHRR